MICVDTTFLIDLWREKEALHSPARDLLASHRGEEFVVPVHAAGEFLEGGATVSPQRLAEALVFLRMFRVAEAGVETALRYARIVAQLRLESTLAGRSKPDLWIAALTVEYDAPLATRNAKHFRGIAGLELISY